jgi:hypothetical protein
MWISPLKIKLRNEKVFELFLVIKWSIFGAFRKTKAPRILEHLP